MMTMPHPPYRWVIVSTDAVMRAISMGQLVAVTFDPSARWPNAPRDDRKATEYVA